jgi:PcRGLX-like protein central beta sandwich domain/Fibronectin type III domain/Beta-L-arabinofuranosidase, GH127 catalytic domain
MSFRSSAGLFTGLLLASLFGTAGAGLGGESIVKLTVHESGGIDRTDEPVSGGVPLPRGLVKDVLRLRLVGPGGKEVPAQFSAINKWISDGSVMWLLVQSRASVKAGGAAVFELRKGAPAARKNKLKVTDGPDVITVDTGRIKFSVSKKKFNLIDAAWLDANGDGKYAADEQVVASDKRGGSAFSLKAKSEVYTSSAGAPKNVGIEEQGGERVIIHAQGLHRPEGGKGYLPYCYGYDVRIRAYAGKPYVRISYALTSGHQPGIGAPVCRELVVGIPLKLAGESIAFGGRKGKVSGKLADGKSAVLLSDAEAGKGSARSGTGYRISTKLVGLEGTPADGRLGWVAVAGSKAGASLAVRYLRENHSCALEVKRAGGLTWLSLKPWPGEVKKNHHMPPCARKTYELQLTLLPGNQALEKAQQLFTEQDSYLRFWPPLDWTASTGAWGDFGGLASPDARAKKALKRLKPYRPTGWFHLGTLPEMESGSSRAPSGGYEPLITTAVWYNGYMQVGARKLFDQLERTSWQWRDGRMIHRDDDVSTKRWEGSGSYRVYVWKGGAKYPEVQLENFKKRYNRQWSYGGAWGPMDTQHFSADEVANYFYLTGDRQCIEALNKMAELAGYLARTSIASVKKSGSSRAHGWCMRALMTAYEATGEQRWLELSKGMTGAILMGQDKTAGTISPVRGKSKGGKAGYQVPFMAAAVGMALGRYYKHHPEEELRDGILGLADWLCYDVRGDAGGFSYRWYADRKSGRSVSGNRCMNTMSWAYMATGQKRYLEAAAKHAAGWKESRWYLSGFGQDYLSIKHGKRADGELPGAVKDLAVRASGGGSVTLTWTAPGDDGATGQATEYQIKYSQLAIKERSDWRKKPKAEISFWAATNCKGEPRPQKAGGRESFTVKNLKPGTHYFALKTYDEQPNQSNLSNVVKVEVK